MTKLLKSFWKLSITDDDTKCINKFREQVLDELNTEENINKNPAFKRFENNQDIISKVFENILDDNKLLIFLVCVCQFGKTQIFSRVLCDILSYSDNNKIIPPPYVFVISGLLDNSWKEQTKQRLLPCIRENVWHNADLRKNKNKELLKKAIESKYSTIIVIDEVHIGCGIDNTIFKELKKFHPNNDEREISQENLFEYFHIQKVKLLFVSATPDGVLECVKQNMREDNYEIIMPDLNKFPEYIWQETYMKNDLIKETRDLHILEDDISLSDEIIQKISTYTDPLYHIIRLKPNRINNKTNTIDRHYDESIKLLEESIVKYNQDINIINYDSTDKNLHLSIIENKIKPKKIFYEWNSKKENLKNMTTEDMLLKKPKTHTLIIIKELFRVAQTLPNKYIGILVERPSNSVNCSTQTQGLSGRMCGFNKKEHMHQTLIYTNITAIEAYINIWNKLMDYSMEPYCGYGIKSKKNNTLMVVSNCLTGDGFDKEIVVDETTEKKIECNEENYSIDYNKLSNKEKQIYDDIIIYLNTQEPDEWISRGTIRKEVESISDYRDLTVMHKKFTNELINFIIKKEKSRYYYKLIV